MNEKKHSEWLEHFRVITYSTKGTNVLPNLFPSTDSARRAAADAIRGGGTAFILQAVEVWQDKGATFTSLPLHYWPKNAADEADHEDLPRFEPDFTPGRPDFEAGKEPTP